MILCMKCGPVKYYKRYGKRKIIASYTENGHEFSCRYDEAKMEKDKRCPYCGGRVKFFKDESEVENGSD